MLKAHPIGKNCLATNQCPCLCPTDEVIMSDDSCDQKCFPPMMNKEDWGLFKAANRIFVDIHRNQVIHYI